jgi:hypothetical protein
MIPLSQTFKKSKEEIIIITVVYGLVGRDVI